GRLRRRAGHGAGARGAGRRPAAVPGPPRPLARHLRPAPRRQPVDRVRGSPARRGAALPAAVAAAPAQLPRPLHPPHLSRRRRRPRALPGDGQPQGPAGGRPARAHAVKPFRFGVQAWTADSRRAWEDQARQAADLGYSTLFLPDHLGDQLAPVPAMVAAADAAPSLRVGTLVFANDFRHPLVLATEASTMALLTDGRLELGIGAGWNQGEYDEAGIAFARRQVSASLASRRRSRS